MHQDKRLGEGSDFHFGCDIFDEGKPDDDDGCVGQWLTRQPSTIVC